MFPCKQLLEATSVIAAFVSGMTLFYAGLGVPPEQGTWDGTTPQELAVKRRQRIMTWVGIPLAVLAAISQLSVILFF